MAIESWKPRQTYSRQEEFLLKRLRRHIARDLDFGLILACAMTAANRPEEDAAKDLEADLQFLKRSIGELYIDRAYINAPIVEHVLDRGGEIICRPWASKIGKLFPKSRFDINVRDRTITCPADHAERIEFVSPSSTRSLTPAVAKVAVRDIAAVAETCTTGAALRRSPISKRSSASSPQTTLRAQRERRRNHVDFKPFGALAVGLSLAAAFAAGCGAASRTLDAAVAALGQV